MMSKLEKMAEEHSVWCMNQTYDPTTKRYGISNYESAIYGWRACREALLRAMSLSEHGKPDCITGFEDFGEEEAEFR